MLIPHARHCHAKPLSPEGGGAGREEWAYIKIHKNGYNTRYLSGFIDNSVLSIVQINYALINKSLRYMPCTHTQTHTVDEYTYIRVCVWWLWPRCHMLRDVDVDSGAVTGTRFVQVVSCFMFMRIYELSTALWQLYKSLKRE